MAREPGVLAQELAILLWITLAVNAFTWSFTSQLVLESTHRKRYDQFRTRAGLVGELLRRPMSAWSTLRSDTGARNRALGDATDDPAIERLRQRYVSRTMLSVAVVFLGLPAAFLIVGSIRIVLPGTVSLWFVGLDVVLFALWVRTAARSLASGSRSPALIVGAVAGAAVCLISAASVVFLWQMGGLPL